MSQRDGQSLERTDTELVDGEALARAQDEAATMPHSELRRYHDDVRTALEFPERVEHLERALGAPQVVLVNLPVAVVVELPRIGDLAHDQVDAGTVGHRSIGDLRVEQTLQSELARNSECSFHPVGGLELAIGLVVPCPHSLDVEARQQAGQDHELIMEGLGARVLGRVGVA